MDAFHVSSAIRIILTNAFSNISGARNNFYCDKIIQLGIFIYIQTSRKFYNFFCTNFHFPSCSTIFRHMNEYQAKLLEGRLYAKELAIFLEKKSFPKIVCISEDATKIVPSVEYDASQNIMLGFVAPFDENGLVSHNNYEAKSACQIALHFQAETPKSSYVSVILARSYHPCKFLFPIYINVKI
jgi:hypothetical protein